MVAAGAGAGLLGGLRQQAGAAVRPCRRADSPLGRTLLLRAAAPLSTSAAVRKRALDGFNVALVRHGNTNKNPNDFERTLTEKGRAQARAASVYMRTLGPFAPVVVSSGAPRCVETARLALTESGITCENYHFTVVKPDCLYGGTLQPAGSMCFAQLGYAPLKEYRAAEHMLRYLDNYAERAVHELHAAASRCGHYGEPVPRLSAPPRLTLCVFGHAIYLPSIALRIAIERELGQEHMERILSTNTKEACGYFINQDSVRLLETEAAEVEAQLEAARARAEAAPPDGAAGEVVGGRDEEHEERAATAAM